MIAIVFEVHANDASVTANTFTVGSDVADKYMTDKCVTFGCWDKSYDRDMTSSEGRLMMVSAVEA